MRGAKFEGHPCIKCGCTSRYAYRRVCVECVNRRNQPLILRAKVDRIVDKIDALPAEGRELLFKTLGVTP